MKTTLELTYDGLPPVAANVPRPDALLVEVVPAHYWLRPRVALPAAQQQEAASCRVGPQRGGAERGASRKTGLLTIL